MGLILGVPEQKRDSIIHFREIESSRPELRTFTFVVESVVIGDVSCALSGQTTNSITK